MIDGPWLIALDIFDSQLDLAEKHKLVCNMQF